MNVKASPAVTNFRLLSLDGGGAKGFYTLGVLREIEAMTGRPLCETFQIIFGTSTGSIIATLLALGHTVQQIYELYCTHVPTVLKACGKTAKSLALRNLAMEILGDLKFDSVKTGIGIVATNWDTERPMIFKGHPAQAHGRVASFVPGFGCTLADAVQASCSAFPFFEKTVVKTSQGDEFTLIDGGYCANNPTLFAIADALAVLANDRSTLRVLSIGVGEYPQPKRSLGRLLADQLLSVQLLQKTLDINTASMEQLRQIIFGDITSVRINDTFDKPEMATDLFEHNLDKLNVLRQRGAESFAAREAAVKTLLEV